MNLEFTPDSYEAVTPDPLGGGYEPIGFESGAPAVRNLFERTYLDYRCAETLTCAAWLFSRVVFDRRSHRNAFRLHVAKYRENKELHWDGSR